MNANKNQKPKIDDHELVNRLRAKYPAPEYATFFEVPDSAGKDSRRADCLSMGLWPSRGIFLTGFEIKCSRSDVLSELKDVRKCEAFAQYCDFWYLVVADISIIKPEELPVNWGLMIPHGAGLKVHKQAPKLEPIQMGKRFIASIMRRTQESDANDITKIENSAFSRGMQAGLKTANGRLQDQIDYSKNTTDMYRNAVRDFQERSGVSIQLYQAGKIGDAVNFVLSGGLEKQRTEFEQIKSRAQAIIDTLNNLEGNI